MSKNAKRTNPLLLILTVTLILLAVCANIVGECLDSPAQEAPADSPQSHV